MFWNFSLFGFSGTDQEIGEQIVELQTQKLQTVEKIVANWQDKEKIQTNWSVEKAVETLVELDDFKKDNRALFFVWLKTSVDTSPVWKSVQDRVETISVQMNNLEEPFWNHLSKLSAEKQQELLAIVEKKHKSYIYFLKTLFNRRKYLLSVEGEKVLTAFAFHPEKWFAMTEHFLSEKTVTWQE